MKFLKYIFPAVMLASLLSCSGTNECREKTSVNVQVDFYNRTLNTTTKQYTYNTLSVDSVWVNGVNVDSMLYKKAASLSKILVPLKKTATKSDFIVRFNNTTDTLTIVYQNNDQYYISLECGCVVAHTIDEVFSTNHYIDSIAIINRGVTNTNAENIRLYHF
jgi:hypothetical protein